MRPLSLILTAAGTILSFGVGVLLDDGGVVTAGAVVIVAGLAAFGWTVARRAHDDLRAGHHISDDELLRIGAFDRS